MPLSAEKPIFRTYLRTFLFATVAVFALTVGLNRLIDPYGLHTAPRISGINAVKPEFSSHLRLSKAAAVRQIQPRAVVLGSSRAEYGIDPAHPGWGTEPVYNLALSGANLYEAVRYLQHASALQPIGQAILMMDLFMFNANSHPDEIDFDETRLALTFEGEPTTGCEWTDTWINHLSLDALFSTIQTLRKQNDMNFTRYLDNGMRESTHNRANIKSAGGRREAFLSNEKGYFNSHYHNFSFANKRRDNLALFRKLMVYAHEQQIALYIGISPSHARQFETIAAKGIWPQFEQWKRHLVKINEEEASWLGRTPFPIWDFSGYNSMTTEPVPPPGDRESEMRWYWESSHYKKELGDYVLDRVFNHHEPGRTIPDDFGILLSSENIDPHLARIRADRAQWRTTHPEDVAEIEALRRATNQPE